MVYLGLLINVATALLCLHLLLMNLNFSSIQSPMIPYIFWDEIANNQKYNNCSLFMVGWTKSKRVSTFSLSLYNLVKTLPPLRNFAVTRRWLFNAAHFKLLITFLLVAFSTPLSHIHYILLTWRMCIYVLTVPSRWQRGEWENQEYKLLNLCALFSMLAAVSIKQTQTSKLLKDYQNGWIFYTCKFFILFWFLFESIPFVKHTLYLRVFHTICTLT